MFQRILVPLDGSEAAERVVVAAEGLRAPGAVLHLIRVNPVPSQPPTAHDEALQIEAESYLDFIVTRLTDRGVAAQWETRCGDISQEVLAAAREHTCDLIAISSHGRSGVARLVYGSVAEQVLRTAQTPTLFVRALPSIPWPNKLESILVPLDGTPYSEGALEPTMRLAREHAARLHLFTAIDPLWAAGDSKLAREQLKEVRRISDRHRQLVEQFRTSHIAARSLIVRGDPATEVLTHAARYGIGLIVMTPTSSDRPAVFGHVSEKILHTAPLPVLVVRKPVLPPSRQ